MRAMERVTATCAHCEGATKATIESCPVGAGAGHHCLRAQGWFRASSGTRNWSCPVCAVGYWKAPEPSLLAETCAHHDDLRQRLGGQAAADAAQQAAPPPTAAARGTLISDILAEIEDMGARLGDLTRTLREHLNGPQRDMTTDGADVGDLAIVDGA